MSRPHSTSSPEPPAPGPWWRDAVFYQIYPRSFADADGDGIGDLAGIRDRLGYIELLGADAIWLNPVMRSPMADHGYDVSDPRDIDPLFGDLDDFDELVREAHARRIRVVMDLVPNHTSSAHPWFAAALAAPPGSRERARYHFRDGRGPDGDEPPNNWPSIFGGPAWTHITDPDPNGQQHQGRPGQQHQGRPGQQHQGRPGQQHQGRPGQWYLHLFAP
ncbi:alpha-amylase family glycosyl hydrolase, partial [Rhodococcus zopfii]